MGDEYLVTECFVTIFSTGDDTGVYSGCGGFAKRDDDMWCFSDDFQKDICCGDAFDCCDIKWGLIVLIIFAFVAVFTGCIIMCCCLCTCCPCHPSKRNSNNEEEAVEAHAEVEFGDDGSDKEEAHAEVVESKKKKKKKKKKKSSTKSKG